MADRQLRIADWKFRPPVNCWTTFIHPVLHYCKTILHLSKANISISLGLKVNIRVIIKAANHWQLRVVDWQFRIAGWQFRIQVDLKFDLLIKPVDRQLRMDDWQLQIVDWRLMINNLWLTIKSQQTTMNYLWLLINN